MLRSSLVKQKLDIKIVISYEFTHLFLQGSLPAAVRRAVMSHPGQNAAAAVPDMSPAASRRASTPMGRYSIETVSALKTYCKIT